MASRDLIPVEPKPLEAPIERYPQYHPETFGTAGGDPFPLAEYWRLLVKRRWMILLAFVVVVGLTTLYTLRQTRIYEAIGRVNISRETNDALNSKDTPNGSWEDYDPTIALETQVRVLQGDTLALQAIHALNLDSKPAFAGAKASAANARPATGVPLDVNREDALLRAFHTSMKVATIPNTRIIEVRFSSPDPRLAAEVVNTLTRLYIEDNIKARYESTMAAVDWLTKQLADLQIKVETSQEKLVQYQKAHNIVGLDDRQNITTSKLDELNHQLTAAENDRIQKQTLFELSRNTGDRSTAVQGNLVGRLRDQLSELESQRAQLSVQYGPAHPKVQEVQSRIEDARSQLQNEVWRNQRLVENDYQAAMRREQMLRASLEHQKAEANQLNENAIEYNLLRRDADGNRQIYESMLQKLKEAALAAGLKSSNVRLVDAARVPAIPAKPDIPRNLSLGVVLGLALGVALAFTLDALDSTVRSPSDAELLTSLPSLGIIPLDQPLSKLMSPQKLLAKAGGTKPGLAVITRPRSDIAEAYRSLRTSILLSSPAGPPKVLAVTSALPQEGKTTTSINTALVLAQHGKRVLLVDADLRRPGLDKIFGFRAAEGLSNVLVGGTRVESVLRQVPQHPNLYLLPAGPPPPHPAELLGSPAMVNLVLRWREEYDHVVIDTPPVLSVTDPVLISVLVDSVILVVRSGVTSRPALRRASEVLGRVRAPVLGVVLNALNVEKADYYYYSYYGTGGRYSYHSEPEEKRAEE